MHPASVDITAQCSMTFLAEKCTEILRTDKEIGGNRFQSQFRVHIVLFNIKLDICNQGGFAGDCIFPKVFQYRGIMYL